LDRPVDDRHRHLEPGLLGPLHVGEQLLAETCSWLTWQP
jgi:hypothetical protein